MKKELFNYYQKGKTLDDAYQEYETLCKTRNLRGQTIDTYYSAFKEFRKVF